MEKFEALNKWNLVRNMKNTPRQDRSNQERNRAGTRQGGQQEKGKATAADQWTPKPRHINTERLNIGNNDTVTNKRTAYGNLPRQQSSDPSVRIHRMQSTNKQYSPSSQTFTVNGVQVHAFNQPVIYQIAKGEAKIKEKEEVVQSATGFETEEEMNREQHKQSEEGTDMEWGQVENARDLGGITLAAGARVRAHRLFRGPPLANLSEKDCAEVAKLGLHSVIDLRIDSEVSLQPDQACALDHAPLVAAPLPVPYNVSAADYIAVLDARESMVKVFEVLGDAARYPVYFHCTWGRDRTGILAAVILLALGASQDAIMEDYLESRRTVGAYPASLEAALEEIQKRGGIDAYLMAAGVRDEQLMVLRATAAP